MLPSGTRNLTAYYSGASGSSPANSPPVVQVVTPVSAGSPQPGGTVQVGSSPVAIAAGDLNGDGKIDLVVANSGSGAVSVLLGTGTGTFAPKVDYPAGAPTSVVLADFNGDGNLDLAVTNGAAGTVSILFGSRDRK